MKTALMLAALGACAAWGGGTSKGVRPTITLRVVNEGGVDNRTLLKAGKDAAAILDRSGIDLVWLTCEAGQAVWGSGNPCYADRGASDFWMRIVVRKPRATTDEMLGFTLLDEASGEGSAGVYYPVAVEAAKKGRVDVHQVLGAAIVHEVGHLMLGANAHSAHGLMSPSWSTAHYELIAIGELSFTSEQAKLLRDEVRGPPRHQAPRNLNNYLVR